MCHAHDEKKKKTNNGRNGTAKSRKNQNALRKGQLQVLNERKTRKVYLGRMRNLLETKLYHIYLIKHIDIRDYSYNRQENNSEKWTKGQGN